MQILVTLVFFLLSSFCAATVKQDMKKAAIEFDVRYKTLSRIARVESRYNPKATTKYSSAKGLFQITRGTEKAIKALCSKCEFGNIFNALQNSRMAAWLTKHNTRSLVRVLKRQPKDWEIYTVHNLGLKYSTRLLKEKNTKNIGKVLPRNFIRNNRSLYTKNGKLLTVSGVKANIKRLIEVDSSKLL